MIKTDGLKALLLTCLLLSVLFPVKAQTDSLSFQEVRSLAGFYEYLLNTLGAEKTSVRDKEVIINESFRKVFMNANVQIEDDLLPDRKVITNKNVDAYLRDVDFFFKDISFDFENIEISKNQRQDSGVYFLVQFESLLKGTTLEGEAFERRNPRYLEINIDPASKDLKIASVYSTKVTRAKELSTWWENLPNNWKSILIEYISFDSIAEDLPLRIAELDSVNLKDHLEILDIEPLQALKNLRYVNLTNTQVVDLTPIRYASNLQVLELANTPMFELKTLPYFKNLQSLNIENTLVLDLQPLSNLQKLQELNVSAIAAENFTPIMDLKKLEALDAAQTTFSSLRLIASASLSRLNLDATDLANLSHAEKLPKLATLSLDGSKVLSLEGIEKHPGLTEISIKGTMIRDLSPLSDVPNLKQVKADNTPIEEKVAAAFMRTHPGVAVITNSDDLTNWWKSLSPTWKKSLVTYSGANPGESELAKLFQIDSLTLTDTTLHDSAPLQKFTNLVYLDIRETALDPSNELKALSDMEHLSASGSKLSSLRFASSTPNLRILEASGTNVSSVAGLETLKKLERVDLERCPVSSGTNEEIESLITSGFPGIIVYRSEALKAWRDSIKASWTQALTLEGMNAFELHKIAQQQEITINRAAIYDLSGLLPLFNLISLQLNEVQLRDLSGIQEIPLLERLSVTNSPLEDISALHSLKLKTLDLANTAVEDLDALESMVSLTSLNCSGTQIRRIKTLESLKDLEKLNVSNTRVFRLDKLSGMTKLQKLVCYNTKLRQSEVDDFKRQFPNCEVLYY